MHDWRSRHTGLLPTTKFLPTWKFIAHILTAQLQITYYNWLFLEGCMVSGILLPCWRSKESSVEELLTQMAIKGGSHMHNIASFTICRLWSAMCYDLFVSYPSGCLFCLKHYISLFFASFSPSNHKKSVASSNSCCILTRIFLLIVHWSLTFFLTS